MNNAQIEKVVPIIHVIESDRMNRNIRVTDRVPDRIHSVNYKQVIFLTTTLNSYTGTKNDDEKSRLSNLKKNLFGT